tara:strand:- start:417 stop:956 length:540 start_codon:yes stop_codon:yes gene_type:complete
MKTIKAYTDGSAVVKGKLAGAGGFGTYFPDLFGSKKAFSSGFKKTKTGRMEIRALYHAVKAMPSRSTEPIQLVVFSDSEYVVKSFTEGRLKKWILAGWRNTSGAVKNKDLWEGVVNEIEKRDFLTLTLKHIRSHQVEKESNENKKKELLKNPDIIGNMVADRLADYKRHVQLLDSDSLT